MALIPAGPPWLNVSWDNATEAPPGPGPDVRHSDGTFVRGVSGNPDGRPLGAKDRRALMAQAFTDNGEAIAAVVIKKALDGDLTAAGMVLQRLIPPKRPVGEKTPFTLDTRLPLAQQAAQVVQAVADGHLAGDDAQVVLGCLQTYAALKQADDLEGRIRALEGRASLAAPRGGIVEMEDQ